ncbi:Crp/Fnr family transcriptional regulator [Vibrio sp. SCSIO 43135]|uniref:Crp/Fnr family transcriptional regulator n=1 Tax=Vibrio sp. SCSIO 43135 TaxID=2819096 RepID=UPI00207595A8|nr:Crp/Fnr family transcriptional regulator [Vibrio sp. SCSIO 43135]USD42731.1 Crp/Fnr family transcriptional regulator [Vibrio sp. SCSIO 43135]
MEFSEYVKKYGKRVCTKQGEYIFHQGESSPHLYSIQRGILKAVYVTEDGKELIKSFLQEGDVIGSMTAAYAQKKTTFGLVALSDTELLQIDFQDLYQTTQQDEQLAQQMIQLLLSFAMKKEQRERDLLCLSAEQRFTQLVDTAPELLERVTQNDIARYLGITPVGLSRIKHRVMP